MSKGASFKMPADTKGNRDLPPNRSDQVAVNAASESTVGDGKYVGKTKGNKDLPPNRTAGVTSGKAGVFIAGRRKPY